MATQDRLSIGAVAWSLVERARNPSVVTMPGRAIWNGAMFRTVPEVGYLALAASLAVFITASDASSRTLLTRLTPPEEIGTFFGLYALSGTATVWIGSALVLAATRLTHTPQAGFVALALLMTLGLVGLMFVQGGGRMAGGVEPEAIEAATTAWTSPAASTRP